MTKIKSLFAGLLVASSLAYAGAAQAGEVGVSNRNSDGYSESNTHVDFTSYELHQGTESNWAYADKTYTAGTYAPEYISYGTNDLVPSITTTDLVHSSSGSESSGTYFIEDKAKGYTDIKSYSSFTDHTTTAFSNP